MAARITYQYFVDNILNGTKHFTKKQIYHAYLQTDKWYSLRNTRLAIDKYICRLCGDKADCVHHCIYPDILGTETTDHLTSFCTPCHTNYHSPPGVAEIQKQFFETLSKGKSTNCPTCKRYAKYELRGINGTMARSLIWLVYEFRKINDWVNVPVTAPKWLISTNQHTTLAKWGLIEKKNNLDESKKSSGYWRPTELGLQFVDGQCKVPEKVCLWDDTRIGHTDESISIQDAVQNGGFNYQDILKNPNADVEKITTKKARKKNTLVMEKTNT